MATQSHLSAEEIRSNDDQNYYDSRQNQNSQTRNRHEKEGLSNQNLFWRNDTGRGRLSNPRHGSDFRRLSRTTSKTVWGGMMSKINEHYAFPDSTYSPQLGEVVDQQGLTKREYFAICAMQGLLANEYLGTVENIEECSVRHADRLIEALNLGEEE